MLPTARRRLSPRWRRMLDHSPDLVGWPASYLEIDPRLHLGDHTEQDEQNPRKTDRCGEQRQWRLNERDARIEFENQCPRENQRRETPKTEPDRAAKLDLPIAGPL